jgi:restriction system protein
MARRRGIAAEIVHQIELASRQSRQAAQRAERARAAANRRTEQARRQAERAQIGAGRAVVAQARNAQREAQRAYDEAKTAEAAAMTAELLRTYEEVDGLLVDAVNADARVNLDIFQVRPEPRAFPCPELEQPLLPPQPAPTEPEPVFVEPPEQTGLSGLLSGKKRHAAARDQALGQFALAEEAWRDRVERHRARHTQQLREYRDAEVDRQSRLAKARIVHQADCERIAAEAADSNRTIDRWKRDLSRGYEYAVHEYVDTVLGKSIYPDAFPIDHDFEFDSDSGELTLSALLPAPDALPAEREFKYVKARGQIVSSLLPKTEQRARYTGAVHQVALRSLHEVFTGDSQGWVKTISLTVACDAIDGATGLLDRVVFVRMAADRNTFKAINLAGVAPTATLQHLGAVLSKKPFELLGLTDSQGVRRL